MKSKIDDDWPFDDCDNAGCINGAFYKLRTHCVCRDELLACIVCLPEMVNRLSARYDPHMNSNRVTVVPLPQLNAYAEVYERLHSSNR